MQRLPDRTKSLPLSPCSVTGGGSRDHTLRLSDQLLLCIFDFIPRHQHLQISVVCKRWLRLLGRLRRTLTLREWAFLPKVPLRFPEISSLNLIEASFATPSSPAPGVLLSSGSLSLPLPLSAEPPLESTEFVPDEVIDSGLESIARVLPNLTRLAAVAPDSFEAGLMAVAQECSTLQELELLRCTDLALRPISAFANLQILKLVGCAEGLYTGPGVTDIGLTILAHGCNRLVRLELVRCEGSYDGIGAIGRCCPMLEELTLCDHKMDAGWTAALAFCGNLKTLRLVSCKKIDDDPGPIEHVGSCPAIERLQMQRCQLRDKQSLRALFVVCEAVREIMFQDCWGMDNEMFNNASICRRVKFLALDGCSQMTTEGLESVILLWNDLERLVVVSCNKIKDSEVSPALSSLFSDLKEFKWRPDTKSLLSMSLAETGMGKKGARFFKRA